LLLQKVSLLQELSYNQVRLHPLVREFAQRLIREDEDQGRSLRENAIKRLVDEFENLNSLELRALRSSYWECLEQIRATCNYAERIMNVQVERLGQIKRWLGRESYLLADGKWWPKGIPGLFYQQLYNRSVEEGC